MPIRAGELSRRRISFGPGLLDDGNVLVAVDDEVGKARASNPRTAIGQVSSNHYLFVVSDGRTEESEGLSLSELAAFMQSLGVKTAYNLDGGGTAVMFFNHEPFSRQSNGADRRIGDILVISEEGFE